MQKRNKTFITICLFAVLAFAPAFGAKFPENTQILDNSSMELIHHDVDVKDLDINPINTNAVEKSVIPNPKAEGKKVLGLFFKTMSLCLLCALLTYIILLFVKKFNASAFVTQEPQEFEELDLTIPENKQEALKSFFNRTK